MTTLPEKSTDNEIAASIHLEYIQNLAAWRNGDGIDDVEAYHRALFLNRHGPELERLQQQQLLHENRLQHLEFRLKEAHERLATTDKLLPVTVEGQPDLLPTSPWNTWDRAMFVASILGVAALLVFGVLNISFNLLESGIVTFVENPTRAYLWAALLPVGALAVKVGWDFLQSARLRSLYIWSSLALGLAGVLVWVAAYSTVYPALSQTTADQIDSLSVFDSNSLEGLTPGGARQIDMILVASQAIAEIFLSALLGIYMTILYARHRPVRLAPNPSFTQLDEERRALEATVTQERLALAEARGGETRLQQQLAVFVAYARSLFEKESAQQKDHAHKQRRLLDELAEQIKTQLAAASNGAPDSAAASAPQLALSNPERK